MHWPLIYALTTCRSGPTTAHEATLQANQLQSRGGKIAAAAAATVFADAVRCARRAPLYPSVGQLLTSPSAISYMSAAPSRPRQVPLRRRPRQALLRRRPRWSPPFLPALSPSSPRQVSSFRMLHRPACCLFSVLRLPCFSMRPPWWRSRLPSTSSRSMDAVAAASKL